MYGLISPGSKTLTAELIHSLLPKAETLVDLMSGGCAVSHCALSKAKFLKVVANDIDHIRTDLFQMAVNGELKNEHRWISREDFYLLRDSDPYVWYAWSSNNEGRSYIYKSRAETLYGKVFRSITADSEHDRWDAMRSLAECVNEIVLDVRVEDRMYSHIDKDIDKDHAVMVKLGDLSGIIDYFIDAAEGARLQKAFIKRLMGTSSVDHYFRKSAQWCMPSEEQYAKLQMLLPKLIRPYNDIRADYDRAKTQYDYMMKGKTANERLLMNMGNIEPFNTLDNLRNMELVHSRSAALSVSHKDYAEVTIDSNSVIYCDPPKIGIDNCMFDYRRFYNWCESQHVPCFISEYEMPDSRFRQIAELRTDIDGRTEYLWVPLYNKYIHYEQKQLF